MLLTLMNYTRFVCGIPKARETLKLCVYSNLTVCLKIGMNDLRHAFAIRVNRAMMRVGGGGWEGKGVWE